MCRNKAYVQENVAVFLCDLAKKSKNRGKKRMLVGPCGQNKGVNKAYKNKISMFRPQNKRENMAMV